MRGRLPAAKVANIVAVSKELLQLHDETVARDAEWKAKGEAIADRGEHPLKYLTDIDIIEVSQRIGDVAMSLLAMRQIAGEIIDADCNAAANFAVAIQEMARANVKGLDVCMDVLPAAPRLEISQASLTATDPHHQHDNRPSGRFCIVAPSGPVFEVLKFRS